MVGNSNFKTRRILILASKMGYQTRAFAEVARKLGVEVVFGTDRCHKLDDPWADGAMALHFEKEEEAAREIVEGLRERRRRRSWGCAGMRRARWRCAGISGSSARRYARRE